MTGGPTREVSPRVPLVAASYLMLTRPGERGTEVLLQLRQGTGFMDGWWGCGAAGHVEAGESAWDAAIGEAREELGITVSPTDLVPVATVQRHSLTGLPNEQRSDMFFTCAQWSGEPAVMEPDKSAGIAWFPVDDLPDRVVPHEHLVLGSLPQVPAILTRGFNQSLTLVAAMGSNRVIGADGGMPWHLPADLKHFKATTVGGTLLMGRATWDSIGRPLPGRTSIVLTRDRTWSAPGAIVAHSMPEALTIAPDTELFVVGGGNLYAQTLPWANRLVLTEIDAAPDGDTVFPQFPTHPAADDGWRQVSSEPHDGFTFVEYRRG
ncbi:dihydrofolate reductase [Dermacoccaceae bacterium W4C1]